MATASDNVDLKTLLQYAGLYPWTHRQPKPFALPDLDDHMHRAKDYAGKVVVLYMFSEG